MLLVDADIIVYRIGWACNAETLEHTMKALDEFVAGVIVGGADDPEDYLLFLTGRDNYRNEVATIQPYKGTRTGEKPQWFAEIRQRLVEEWDAIVVEGQEADDEIAIMATTLPTSIIATLDKDLRQVAGRHYNFVKEEHFTVSPIEGMRWLYKQMLTGDRVDNIRGVHGIGDIKADRMLDGLNTEEALHEAVLEAYNGNLAEMTENAILLYMRREYNEWWVPYPIRLKYFNGKNPTEKPDYEELLK